MRMTRAVTGSSHYRRVTLDIDHLNIYSSLGVLKDIIYDSDSTWGMHVALESVPFFDLLGQKKTNSRWHVTLCSHVFLLT